MADVTVRRWEVGFEPVVMERCDDPGGFFFRPQASCEIFCMRGYHTETRDMLLWRKCT